MLHRERGREAEKESGIIAAAKCRSTGGGRNKYAFSLQLAIWQAASQATDLATNHTEPSLTAMSATHPAALLNAKCWSVLAMCLLFALLVCVTSIFLPTT